jgi:hypothetical protein
METWMQNVASEMSRTDSIYRTLTVIELNRYSDLSSPNAKQIEEELLRRMLVERN